MKKKAKVHPLHRQTWKKLTLPKLMAFDMETKGLFGDFIICAFWGSDDTKHLSYTIDDALDFIMEHPGYRWLAHNASGYEFAYLYPKLKERFDSDTTISIRPTLQGDTRVIQLVIYKEGKKWADIRDTLCLFSMSLRKVADAFCPELPKGDIDFEHVVFDPGREDHMSYLWRDCEIILMAYQRFATHLAETFGSPVGVTAGRCALNAWLTTIPEGYVYYRTNKEVEKLVREAYYGACVFPGHQIGNWGHTGAFDINGAYIFQMGTNPYPVGNPAYTGQYWEGELGVYRVIANVDPTIFQRYGINPIPLKTNRGLCWATGTFETTLTSVDIDFARSIGCTVDILYGYVWSRTEYIFREFMVKCQTLELANGGAFKPTIKTLRNAFYGRFGMKEEHDILIFSHETLDQGIPFTIADKPCGENIVENLFIRKEKSSANFMMPHWAAFTTAYERVYLMKFVIEAYRRGAANVYCDTDSIKADFSVLLSMVSDSTIVVGKEYGQWKPEETATDFLLVGPKTYYAETGKVPDKKAKGIPNKRTDRNLFMDALQNQRKLVKFDSGESVMNIIKGKVRGPTYIQRGRKITDMRNSFSWELDAEGFIYPFGYQNPKNIAYIAERIYLEPTRGNSRQFNFPPMSVT